MSTKAGLGSRTAATLLDLALFMPVYYAAVFLLTKLYGRPGDRMWDLNPVRVSATVGNALWLGYSSLEWWAGATPGKLLLGMRIEAAAGGPAPRGQLFLRWAIKQGVRICGLLDAITLTYAVRLLLAKGGLAFFYHEPMNFKLIRDLGEILGLVTAGGFLLVLRPDRRALHDLLTGTAVYRKVQPTSKRGFEPVTERAPLMVQPLEGRQMM